MGDDTATLTEKQVIAFLQKNKAFFVDQAELVEQLQFSDAPAGTISLAQHRTARLNQKNKQLQEQLHALIDNARQNNTLQTRVHQLCLKLMDAPDIEALLPLLVSELKSEFNADEVALRLFYSGDNEPELSLPETAENISLLHSDDKKLKAFDSVLNKQQPVCGRLSKKQNTLLFDQQADKAQSVACLPLGHSPCAGLLAIASVDANRFHADMATDYLSFLGEIIMRLLRPYTHQHHGE